MPCHEVCLVSKYFWPFVGGVELHVLELGRRLCQRGIEVTVVCSNRLYRKRQRISKLYEEFEGIRIHRYRSLCDMRRTLKEVLMLAQLVHIHYYRAPDAALAGCYASKLGRPVVLSSHVLHPPHGVYDRVRKWVYDRTLGRWLVNAAKRIITSTPDDRLRLLRLHPHVREKVVEIPVAIDVRRFEGPPEPKVFRSRYRLPEGARLIGYLGRSDWNKRIDLLVKALPALPSDVHLVVAGPIDDEYRRFLERLARAKRVEDRVHIVGFLPDDLVPAFYRNLSVFALPSEHEGLGLVVLEAMASHVPVVASRQGGTRFVIEDGEDGFLVSLKLGDWVEALSKILEDWRLRSRVTAAAYRKVIQEYSWDVVLPRILKVYEDALHA